MTSIELLNLAERKGHRVVYQHFPFCKSLCVEGEVCYIGLDISLRGIEEKECLAHELGHCEYGGFYNRYSRFDLREKSERRANKWSYLQLVPPSEIKKVAARGIDNPWDMADHFNVSARYMVEALNYYKEAFGTSFAEDRNNERADK